MKLKKTITAFLFLLGTTAFSSAYAQAEIVNENDAAPNLEITRNVNIPGMDAFVPFVINIQRGDVVRFTNNDEDDHSVTSDNAFSSPAYRNGNFLVPKKSSTGTPGSVRLRFNYRGTFTYYCRFHAHVDGDGQPVNGGMAGAGIAGRPMMGVVIVR